MILDTQVYLDSTKWNYDVGGHGWGNNELQFYTKQRLENARVEKGYLIIEARKESWEGKKLHICTINYKRKRRLAIWQN
jgi:hypothetical protein